MDPCSSWVHIAVYGPMLEQQDTDCHELDLHLKACAASVWIKSEQLQPLPNAFSNMVLNQPFN